MASLLVLIYVVFISLGLPDSVLGSVWPSVRTDLGAPLDVGGYVAMVVAGGTIVSSLLSHRLTTRFGTGVVTLVSVALTAGALFGYASVSSVGWLFVMAVPMGLGAGSVDAALNNFIALHYSARHMNWLHCFWGIGATAGPALMSVFLVYSSWRTGFATLGGIQLIVVAALAISLPWWGRLRRRDLQTSTPDEPALTNRAALGLPLVKLALVGFAMFSATEFGCGLWSASYLVSVEGLSDDRAALWAGLFYGGITVGRAVAGLCADRLTSRTLIRIGAWCCVICALVLALPLPTAFSLCAIVGIGLGTAPIFPAMLHETPARFGAAASATVMGLQMAFGYLGGTVLVPLFGTIASATTLKLFPGYLLLTSAVLLGASELLNRKLDRRLRAAQADPEPS